MLSDYCIFSYGRALIIIFAYKTSVEQHTRCRSGAVNAILRPSAVGVAVKQMNGVVTSPPPPFQVNHLLCDPWQNAMHGRMSNAHAIAP